MNISALMFLNVKCLSLIYIYIYNTFFLTRKEKLYESSRQKNPKK